MFIVTKDGKAWNGTNFNPPILIKLQVDPSLNPNLVGTYYLSNDGKLEYVGGQMKDGDLVAKLRQTGNHAVLAYKMRFNDVPSTHWASSVIEQMVAKHKMNGTSNSTFEPERSVTRAEFTAMLVRALNLTERSELKFTDVAADVWYADSISSAVKAGIVTGRNETLFAPSEEITREEMVVMMMRAYKVLKELSKESNNLTPAPVSTFTDEAEIVPWALDAVRAAAAMQLINGRESGRFAPSESSTRAEAAVILNRML
ncbi:Endoglucanase precursor [compost metagenome]